MDEEIRRILNEGHEQALHIIETHREQHKAIAEALLKYETLNEKEILSLYKTGKIPEKDHAAEDEKAYAQTFEESKRALERMEDAKRDSKTEAADNQAKDDQPVSTDNHPTDQGGQDDHNDQQGHDDSADSDHRE